tara:strand:- start:2371 stop:3441 length:1071 start_codon:yes stop_codon:yes gene_type:complete
MKNKYVQSVKPYKPSDRKSFKEVDLFLDWNESDLIWKRLNPKLALHLNSKALNRYPELDNSKEINLLRKYVKHKCSIDLYPGSDNAHEYILRAFGKRNSSLLLLDPGYSNFKVTAQSLGFRISTLSLNSKTISNYNLVFEKLLNLKSIPDFFYLINPHSPTGNILSKKQIEMLVKKFKKSFFIIDEAYVDFNLNLSSASLVSKYSNIIITRSFSKAFSLAGSRIGFSITNKSNSTHLKKIINTKHLTNFSRSIITHTMKNINELNDHIVKINKNINKIHNLFKKTNLSKLDDFNTNFYFILFADSRKRNHLYNHFLKNKILTRKIDFLKNKYSGLRITIPSKKSSFKKLLEVSKLY